MTVDMQRIMDLAGPIPFDNIDNAKAVVENFCTNDIAVVATNKSTNIFHGTHHHDSYEFVIVYNRIPSCIIDNKACDRPANVLFAVNPMQEHGLLSDVKGFNLCGIHIDKKLLQSVADSIYGSSNIVFSNDSSTINHDLSMLVCLFLEELRYKQPGQDLILDNLGMLITASILRQIKHNIQPKPHNLPKTNKINIKKVIDYMNANFTSGVSCNELSKLVKMDKFSLIRSFKAQTSKTPYEYLLDLKIEKAKKMLKVNKYSITEISMMCGFSSHSHFTSTFKKKTGVSPTEYRLSL